HKHLFPPVLLLALALTAGAQPSPPAPGAPSGAAGVPRATGTPIAPVTNNAAAAATTTPVPARPMTPAAPPAGRGAPPVVPPAPAPPANAGPAGPAVPAAPAAPAETAYIKYNWTMPVDEVIDLYAKLVGRTALRSGTVGTATVTLKTFSLLTESEAVQALETLLGMNGITVVPIGDKFFKVVAQADVAGAGAKFSTTSADKLPESGKLITEIVQLKYADPQQVFTALQQFAKAPNSLIYIPSTQSLILRDYTENVKRMMEMLEKIDVTSPLIIKPEIIPIKYALASDIASALSQLGAGGGASVGKPQSGADFKASATGGTAGSGFGGGGAPGGATPYGTSTQRGASTGATGATSNFGQRLGAIVNNAAGGGPGAGSLFGQTKIIADERTNSLLVFANDDDMKMIKEIIGKLDVVLAQVLIEALVLEVNLSDTRNTGVSMLQNQLSSHNLTGAGGINNLSSGASSFLSGSSTGTNGSSAASSPIGNSVLSSLPGGFSYFGKYGNDLDIVAEAVAGDSRISVLSRPRIQTSHAVEAELFIGQTVPYVTGTQNYGYSTGPSATYQQMEVGIRLRVLPLINVDGLVEMDIDTEVEQLGAPVAIPGAGNVPTTTKRDAGAKVAVLSGDTIILGGFISASRSKSSAGVPWLMSIPVLGHLFKSTAIDNERTELIVLMRPTVLKTPQIAAKVAANEKHQMALVEQAEVDIRNDEEKRNAAAAAELKKEQEKRAKMAAKAGTNSPGTNTPVNLELPNTQTNAASQSEMEQP
ncbi:MAG: secretin N-terminal domain-containing protein, partial [Verrucomicrobiota bacterium]